MALPATGRLGLILLLAITTGAPAQGLLEQETLSFGILAVPSNSVVSALTLAPDGSVTTSGDLFVLQAGTAGRYQATGFTPGVELAVEIIVTPLFRDVDASRYLTITALDYPETITTNGAGGATFSVGATLQTTGNGFPYIADDYSATLDITLTPP